MRMKPFHLAATLLGVSLLAGCAAAPEAPRTSSRTDAAEPVTGSNLPRRDRRSVSNVTIAGPEAVREAQESPKASAPPSN